MVTKVTLHRSRVAAQQMGSSHRLKPGWCGVAHGTTKAVPFQNDPCAAADYQSPAGEPAGGLAAIHGEDVPGGKGRII